MKPFISFISLFLLCASLGAATLSDVEVIDIKKTEDGDEVKLKDKKLTPDGYFYVIMDKADKELSQKLILIKRKQQLKDKFKLSLEIDSFSATPSGSTYQSSSVEFKGK